MRFPPIRAACPKFLHGADYNPEQWLATPAILTEDLRLMKLAHANVMAVGIFAWVKLEPAEGEFTFGWLDQVMDRLAANGCFALLATPSSGKPAWLAKKYPEICRQLPDGRREQHHWRHNNCYSSPVYREKIAIINRLLAERYRKHPALLLWHIGNEYGGPSAGECYCPHCYRRFREWLQRRYGSLEALNEAWWTSFWGHCFTDWEQIEPLNRALHGLMLDWKRFTTWNMVDFIKHEIAAVKAVAPEIPVTNNTMGTSPVMDYWQLAPHLDVVSVNLYPEWDSPRGNREVGIETAFVLDVVRAEKRRPFLLMECTPSMTNSRDVCRPKRPGTHRLAALQAVAHGADSVQYFQWRQSRGAFEKFHGAVVTQAGHEHTRVFREVAEVGCLLAKLGPVLGACPEPEVALVFDWDCRWALEMGSGGPGNQHKHYEKTVQEHYAEFWARGIPVDVINADADFQPYRLLVAPMLYLLRPGVAERIANFVHAGGTLVATYLSGVVNASDLCSLGGSPGPLREVLGLWVEETDAFYDGQAQSLRITADFAGLHGDYAVKHYADVIHLDGARPLAIYNEEFYAGQPALTSHDFGKGRAYYMAARCEPRFLSDFYGALARQMDLQRALEAELPRGVTAQIRRAGARAFIFLANFGEEAQNVSLPEREFINLLNGKPVRDRVTLNPRDTLVLESVAKSLSVN